MSTPDQDSTWAESLIEGVQNLISENPGPPLEMIAFRPPIIIEFLTGLQTGQRKILGYGPRKFGANSLDIELFDSKAPALAFEIVPDGEQARFVSHNKDFIELNGQTLQFAFLKENDIISFGKTKIRIKRL